ncbi:DUF1236 domain-containing protein [Devosia sp. A369]
MRNWLSASAAVLLLCTTVPAFAQESVNTETNANAAVGGVAGAGGGAAVGFMVGGPIGAVIGGFAGATLGAATGVAASTVEYAGNHPVEPIYFDSGVDIGLVVPPDVAIYPVEGDDRYGYIYANDRVWIVDLETRALVQSPGYLVPQSVADYAVANPIGSVNVAGDVVVGYAVPSDVVLNPIPDSRSYSYVYINDRPVLVENTSRTVVFVN